VRGEGRRQKLPKDEEAERVTNRTPSLKVWTQPTTWRSESGTDFRCVYSHHPVCVMDDSLAQR